MAWTVDEHFGVRSESGHEKRRPTVETRDHDIVFETDDLEIVSVPLLGTPPVNQAVLPRSHLRRATRFLN